MGLEKNLHLRGRVYYLRLSIPKQLRELRRSAGKRSSAALWKSLGTSDPALARQLVCREKARLLAGFNQEAEALRKGLDYTPTDHVQNALQCAPE